MGLCHWRMTWPWSSSTLSSSLTGERGQASVDNIALAITSSLQGLLASLPVSTGPKHHRAHLQYLHPAGRRISVGICPCLAPRLSHGWCCQTWKVLPLSCLRLCQLCFPHNCLDHSGQLPWWVSLWLQSLRSPFLPGSDYGALARVLLMCQMLQSHHLYRNERCPRPMRIGVSADGRGCCQPIDGCFACPVHA